MQALFVTVKAAEPQDYTSIEALSEARFGAEETSRSFGQIALSPRTIRVGGRRTSVRLEPEFWLAIAYVVAASNIDQGKFFLDIERRSGRFAFASKIRSAVVSALLKMALVDRFCGARLSQYRRAEPAPAKSKAKKRGPKRAARSRTRA